MKFNDLALSPHLLRAVKDLGFTEPTPIQQLAIPAVLEGRDLLGGARTGSGKTAAFALPMLQRLLLNHGRGQRQVRALILAPTRELAAQVGAEIVDLARYLPLRTRVVYGGVAINPDIAALKNNKDGIDVLVATPGRVLDLLTQKALRLDSVETFVLDEADRMLDMGFIRDIEKIWRTLPLERQNLLFSATFTNEIKALADELLQEPIVLEVDTSNTTSEQVVQRIIRVDRDKKREVLTHLLKQEGKPALIFVRTHHIADRLAEQLERAGVTCLSIHGEKKQGERNRILKAFRSGEVPVLVATDIAARGLDIEQLDWVINFELPQTREDYIHRIGRTARAGRGGEALSLVCFEEEPQLAEIEEWLGRELVKEVIVGFEPSGKPTKQTLPGAIKPGKARQHGAPAIKKPRPKKPVAKKAPARAKSESKELDDGGMMPIRRQSKPRPIDLGDQDE